MVFDFDGVMTDNRVWVDEDGREMVAANRSDSLGLAHLREQPAIEADGPFHRSQPGGRARAAASCELPYLQGVDDKAGAAASDTVTSAGSTRRT